MYSNFTEGASIILIILAVIGILIAIAVSIFVIISFCKLFQKAGEPWWKALIPLYSSWVETKMAGLAWWWFLIITGLSAVVSGVENPNYVFCMGLLLASFNYAFNLSKKFGKSNGFAVLLTLLPFVGFPILAFGKATYNADAEVDENGIFSIKK